MPRDHGIVVVLTTSDNEIRNLHLKTCMRDWTKIAMDEEKPANYFKK